MLYVCVAGHHDAVFTPGQASLASNQPPLFCISLVNVEPRHPKYSIRALHGVPDQCSVLYLAIVAYIPNNRGHQSRVEHSGTDEPHFPLLALHQSQATRGQGPTLGVPSQDVERNGDNKNGTRVQERKGKERPSFSPRPIFSVSFPTAYRLVHSIIDVPWSNRLICICAVLATQPM